MEEKKIGEVTIDYQFYNAEVHYSDGNIEDILLEAAKNDKLDELLHMSGSWAVLYHCSNMRENLLEWYPFKEGASLLEIGSGCGALTGLFCQKVSSVTCVELSERRSLINAYRNRAYKNLKIILGNLQDIKFEDKYDYITLIGVWEYAGMYYKSENPYLEMLKTLKRYLKDDGILLIAIENKMGLKYWNGAVEDHTGKMYGGLNDYVDCQKKVRTFSRPEIESLLEESGWKDYRFYYPMPDYKLPEVIYSDERLPQPGELRNYRKDYNATHIYNFYDATVCDQLCSDKMIGYFANSFLVECGFSPENVVYAKYSRRKKKAYGIATRIVEKDGRFQVEKKPLTAEAGEHLDRMARNIPSKSKSLYLADGYLNQDCFISEYIDGQDLDAIFYGHRHDAMLFVEKTKEVINEYFYPEEFQFEDFVITDEYTKLFGENHVKNGKCLKRTNLDMTFSNLRMGKNGKMYCIDNEWVYSFPIPYEYVVWRAVYQLYGKYMIYLRNEIPIEDFYTAVGLNLDNIAIYLKMEESFRKSIYTQDYLSNYRKQAITYDFRFV